MTDEVMIPLSKAQETIHDLLAEIRRLKTKAGEKASASHLGDPARELEKRAQKLVKKGEFKTIAKSETHILESDPVLEAAYLASLGHGDIARIGKGSEPSELEKRAQALVDAGRFDSLSSAMTSLFEEDPKLYDAYRASV